jgi:hypothetical protein
MSSFHASPALSLALVLSVATTSACAGIFSLDEGERLSEQIGHAAQQLRKSSATEMTITYTPRQGVNQRYTVGLAKVRYQPHPPFEPPYPGLTVTVEKGNGGFCNYHVKYVGVPKSLNISKNGAPTQILLRKVSDDEIDVISLRG